MASSWSNFTQIFGWFAFFVSIWSTISLFVVIEKKSPKEFGSYKNFLRIYCFYAFSYAVIDWLVQPNIVVDVYGFGYVFFSECVYFDLGYSANHLLQVLYCGCFIASSSFLSLNFIYRFVSCCHGHYLSYFQGWGLLVWFLYCAIPFAFWSVCVYLLMSPTDERTEHLNFSTLMMERVNLTGLPYVAPMTRHVSNTSEHQFGDIEWSTMTSLFGLCAFQVFFYGVSIVCGILTYRKNMSLLRAAQLSPQLFKIQMQLFRAIVIQATVPLISIYIPPSIMIGGSMMGLYTGKIGYFALMSISIYPPLDSLVFLLSIRTYRDALFCNTKSGGGYAIGNSSVHPGVARPATAKVSDVSFRSPADEQAVPEVLS